MPAEVGQQAPDFTLKDENNQDVKLSDLKGETVVLMFYPLHFSPVCSGEHCSMRDTFYKDFEAAGAKVYGVSRDSTWTHKAFRDQENIPYPLLADMDGKVAKDYGAWLDKFGIAERVTAIIGPDGKIAFLDKTENPLVARDWSKILNNIKN
jgi:mycoredoxin-dependent peroxiredoxin